MENGFTSPKSDAFPFGLRVLVVDDDPTWLKILEKMLKKCSYEVTTCGLAIDALNLLRERKDGYDIVISDVNMPDMDGFKLLEHVGLEMDLPVIMMSVDGETSRVMKGVQHGACDYLLKPIRMKELRNIWQHVFRKKIHEIKDIESHESIEGIHMMRNGSEYSDEAHFFSMEDTTSVRKRKDFENKQDEKDFTDASSTKKARVVWSVDLHQKFVKAVNQIGFDKVGPKKILDLMNVPWLTRENVASHLQKYRLYLSRLQKEKENDLRSSFGGMKHSDTSSKDPSGSFSIQNATNMHNCDVANGSYGFSGKNLLTQNVDTNDHLSDTKASSILDPISESMKASARNLPDSQKINSSQMGSNHSFSSLEHEVNFAAFDSSIPSNYSWSEISGIQFNQEHKKVKHSNNFSKLPPDPQHHIHVEDLQSIPSISLKPPITENGILGSIKSEPSYVECGKNKVGQASLTVSTIESLLPLQNKCQMVNHQDFESIFASASSSKTQGSNLSSITNLESAESNPMVENGQPFPAFDDDLQVFFQGDCCYGTNLGTQNLEIPEYIDPGLVPIHLYDSLSIGYEYPCDPTEYSVIDQGLFIV